MKIFSIPKYRITVLIGVRENVGQELIKILQAIRWVHYKVWVERRKCRSASSNNQIEGSREFKPKLISAENEKKVFPLCSVPDCYLLFAYSWSKVSQEWGFLLVNVGGSWWSKGNGSLCFCHRANSISIFSCDRKKESEDNYGYHFGTY